MAIKVNQNARVDFINQEVKRIISEIEDNAQKGIPITEIFTPLNTAQDVRRQISKTFDGDGTDYEWMIVRRGNNPYTGRVQYFSGETLGDTKRYKLKIG